MKSVTMSTPPRESRGNSARTAIAAPFQLNRTTPAVGVATDIPVAWLHIDSGDLLYLPQRYERRAAHIYFYSAATLGFTAELAVDDDGFVRSYPGLWTRNA